MFYHFFLAGGFFLPYVMNRTVLNVLLDNIEQIRETRNGVWCAKIHSNAERNRVIYVGVCYANRWKFVCNGIKRVEITTLC